MSNNACRVCSLWKQTLAGSLTVTSLNGAGQQACVCRPTIASISAGAITLAVDKPLRGVMLDPSVRWRLDKDEVSSIFTHMRCNLMGELYSMTSCRTSCVSISGYIALVDVLASNALGRSFLPATVVIFTTTRKWYHAVHEQAPHVLLLHCQPPLPPPPPPFADSPSAVYYNAMSPISCRHHGSRTGACPAF